MAISLKIPDLAAHEPLARIFVPTRLAFQAAEWEVAILLNCKENGNYTNYRDYIGSI